MKVFTFVSMLAYTSGFKCQHPNIFSLAIARPTREIVHQYVVYRNEGLRPLLTNKQINSLFRTSGYLGQIIISLVVKEVKHSPFWLGEVDRSHDNIIIFCQWKKKKIFHVFHFY
jgi:hypothetical protein